MAMRPECVIDRLTPTDIQSLILGEANIELKRRLIRWLITTINDEVDLILTSPASNDPNRIIRGKRPEQSY